MKATFDTNFIQEVHQALMNRWREEREGVTIRGRHVSPFKSKVWTIASMFDPCYTPTEDEYIRVNNDDVSDYASYVKELMDQYVTEESSMLKL